MTRLRISMKHKEPKYFVCPICKKFVHINKLTSLRTMEGNVCANCNREKTAETLLNIFNRMRQ